MAVKRRFREFDQLKNKLQESADDLPGIPSKLFNTSPDKRQPKLDSFLKEVVDNVAPTKNTIPVELAEFLGIEKIVTNKKKADDGLKVSYGTPLVNDKFKSLLDHCVSEMFAQSTECEASPFVLVGTQDPWKWYARAAKDGKEVGEWFKQVKHTHARLLASQGRARGEGNPQSPRALRSRTFPRFGGLQRVGTQHCVRGASAGGGRAHQRAVLRYEEHHDDAAARRDSLPPLASVGGW